MSQGLPDYSARHKCTSFNPKLHFVSRFGVWGDLGPRALLLATLLVPVGRCYYSSLPTEPHKREQLWSPGVALVGAPLPTAAADLTRGEIRYMIHPLPPR